MFKKKQEWVKRLVRIQHEKIEDKALEGVWLGMVDGHYHLTAPKIVSEAVKTPLMGDIFIPAKSVLFLEVISEDASV